MASRARRIHVCRFRRLFCCYLRERVDLVCSGEHLSLPLSSFLIRRRLTSIRSCSHRNASTNGTEIARAQVAIASYIRALRRERCYFGAPPACVCPHMLDSFEGGGAATFFEDHVHRGATGRKGVSAARFPPGLSIVRRGVQQARRGRRPCGYVGLRSRTQRGRSDIAALVGWRDRPFSVMSSEKVSPVCVVCSRPPHAGCRLSQLGFSTEGFKITCIVSRVSMLFGIT